MKFDARKHDLGGGFTVNRILPYREKRMVGPFIFLDHMGPLTAHANQNIDVRPHPHIGLSTMTYLFEGRMMHRDSLGYVQSIEPGEVNWMTAGQGISHSERAHEADRSRERAMHGLQFWVALPDGQEECAPSFTHYDKRDIPHDENDERKVTLVTGRALGLESPVRATSPLVFAEIQAKKNFALDLAASDFELAVYLIEGKAGFEGQELAPTQMAAFDRGVFPTLQVKEGSRLIVIGGEPFATPRQIWWNLVSSSREKIEDAKRRWREGSFPMVPGETEFIPLPE